MQIPEHLLLPFMVLGDREGHQLVQGQAILAIDLQQLRTDSAPSTPLLHHMGRHAEPHADFLRNTSWSAYSSPSTARTRVASGKSVHVRLALGGLRIIYKKKR